MLQNRSSVLPNWLWLPSATLALVACSPSVLDPPSSDRLLQASKELEEVAPAGSLELALDCLNRCDYLARGMVVGRVKRVAQRMPELEPQVWDTVSQLEERVLQANDADEGFSADLQALVALYTVWPAHERMTSLLASSRARLPAWLHGKVVESSVEASPQFFRQLDVRDVGILEQLVTAAPEEHRLDVQRLGVAEAPRLEHYRVAQAAAFAEALLGSKHVDPAQRILDAALSGIPKDGCAKLREHAEGLEFSRVLAVLKVMCPDSPKQEPGAGPG